MHRLASRRMRSGLSIETSPISAPYGQKYRHQKFCTKTDATTRTARTIPPLKPSKRKKLSIFTSSTRPYGPSRKEWIAETDIEPTAYTNNPSRMYLTLRKARSSHRGSRKLPPKVCFPRRHRYSEAVPTGQSQLQKLLRRSQDIAKNESSRNIPAGWMRGSSPVARKTLRFMREAIGSQPSTPGGREAWSVRPPVS